MLLLGGELPPLGLAVSWEELGMMGLGCKTPPQPSGRPSCPLSILWERALLSLPPAPEPPRRTASLTPPNGFSSDATSGQKTDQFLTNTPGGERKPRPEVPGQADGFLHCGADADLNQ